MECLDGDEMLAESCDAMGAKVMKSANKQSTAGMRCFAREKIGKPKVVGYHRCTIMFSKLYR